MPFRGFVAVPVPAAPPVVALLEEVARLDADVRAVEPENLHVTLSFLGQLPDEAIAPIAEGMAEAAGKVAPFRLRLAKVGAFPRARDPRVVWVGVEDPRPISELATRTRAALEARGFPGDAKDFRAHLTLARVKGERGLDRLVTFLRLHGADVLDEMDVRETRLFRSVLSPRGPTYDTLAIAPLEG